MSLYAGVIDSRSKEKGGVGDVKWASGLKLLQSQIQLKKATLTQVKRDKLRMQQSSNVITPAVDLSSRNKEKGASEAALFASSFTTADQLEADMPPLSFITNRQESRHVNLLFGEMEVIDEYNPMYPNDFEKIMERKEAEKVKLREEERRRDMEERDRKRRERERNDEEDDDRERERDRQRRSALIGAAIAPPSSLIDEDMKIAEETPKAEKGLGVAAKIMEKYGYKQGQGLGKLEQGMSTALVVEKTGKRGGKILHEKDLPKPEPTAPESITEILKNPTKILLLKNMIGPGQVDDDLEEEVKEECSKYGEVQKCVVFEIPDEPVEEEAVRIFVEFGKMEHAIKAAVDLNGRYFGGRLVRASFYNLDRFRRLDLAD